LFELGIIVFRAEIIAKLNIIINQGNPSVNLRNILDHAQLVAGRHILQIENY